MPDPELDWTFIVRLWPEPRELEPKGPERKGPGEAAGHWRGMVEVVPTGERSFVDDVDQIAPVIKRYLAQGRPA